MFVLMSLMCLCLQRVYVLFFGARQSWAPVKRAQDAIISIANSVTIPIVPLHVPLLGLIV